MPASAVKAEKPSFFEALYAATDADACEVVEGLFLGAATAASDRQAMLKRRISHVLIAHPALAEQHPKSFQHYRVPVIDEPTANLLELLPGALGFLAEARSRGGRAFVYCAKGISRSASIVIALLMLERGIGFSEAFALCEKKRPIAYPNVGFQEQLKQLEALLQATAGCSLREKVLQLRRAVPTGSPLQLQASLDAHASAGLEALEGLIEKVMAQPSLLQGRELWKCHGLLFENLHKYKARAGDRALTKRALDDAARLRALPKVFNSTLRGIQLALAVAKELEAWAALEPLPGATAAVPEVSKSGTAGQKPEVSEGGTAARKRGLQEEGEEERSSSKHRKAKEKEKEKERRVKGKKASKGKEKEERKLERKLAKVERRAREAEDAALAEFRMAEEAARLADEAAAELDKVEEEEAFERRAAMAAQRAGRPGSRRTEQRGAGGSDSSDCSHS